MPYLNLRSRTLLHLITACAATGAFAQLRPAPVPTTDDVVELSQFTVSSTQDTGSYAATNTLAGTRYRVDLLTLPKSVQVVTSELIQDIGARNLVEALQFTPTVSQRSYDGSTSLNSTDFRFRGFSNSVTYRNGFRTAGMVDTINIDRIEVIRGPSTLFSGTTSPGGLINFITKKPTDTYRTEVSARVGSYNAKRAEVSTSGPINAAKTFRYFLAGAIDERETFRDFESIKKKITAAAFDARFGNLYWITETQYLLRDSNLAAATPLANASGTEFVPIRRSFNPAGRNKQETANIVVTSDLDLRINETWSARGAFHYRQTINENDLPNLGGTVAVSPAGVRTISRTARNQFLSTRDSTGQAYLLGQFNYGDIKHRLTLGGERFWGTTFNDGYNNPLVPNRLDIDNPNYDLGRPGDYTVQWRNNRQYVRWWAGSVTNQFDLLGERLTAFHGVRWDDGEIRNHDLRVARYSFTALRARTHSAGVSYRLRPGLAAFVSYGESFQGNAGTDAAGRTFEPLRGGGWDVGMKFNLLGDRVSGSATVFQIEQENILRPDIANPGFNLASGLEESKGFELDTVIAATPSLQLIAGYVYADAYIKSYPDSPQLTGLRVQDTPRHSASAWGKYRFNPATREGWSIGLGVNYIGERRGRFAGDPVGVRGPAYTRFDATLTYDFRWDKRPVSITAGVRNVLDEDYIISSEAYGDPRTFDLSVRARF